MRRAPAGVERAADPAMALPLAMCQPAPMRADGRGKLLMACALLALPVVALLSESLLGGLVLSQSDALLAFQPWKSVAPADYRPENPLLLDQALLMRPWLDYAAERVQAGELPLWNPYNFCGQPLTAAVTGATYWPLHFAYYLRPTPHFFAWSAALRLLAAGVFTLLFLRSLRLSLGSSLVGACAFMLCGFSIAWLNHPHFNAALCLPLVLWQLERLSLRPSLSRAATLAVCLALPMLSGHLQTCLHVLLLAAAYALYRVRAETPNPALGTRGLGLAGLAALGALALAAPQWVPFVEYYAASQGKDLLAALDTVTDFPRGQALAFLFAPEAFGSPHTHDYVGPTGFNVNHNEFVGGFVSRTALMLAVFGLVTAWRKQPARFFAVALVGAALVAYKIPPFFEAARAVPVLGSTKLMRLLLIVAFAACVLAAFGLEHLRRRHPRASRGLVAASFALVALDLVLWGRGYNPAIEADLIAPETEVSRFLARETEPYRVLGVDNTTFLPNANLFHRVPMVSGYDSIEYRPLVELVSRLSTDPVAGFEEMFAAAGIAEPESGFIKEILFFDRREALPLASLLGVKYYLSEVSLPSPLVEREEVRGPLRVFENPNVLPRAFVARDWRVVEDGAERVAELGSATVDPRIVVLESPPPAGLEHTSTAPGTVRLTSYEPRRITLSADMDAAGWVVLADTWDPGWRATVDGEPLRIHRVDHALRGLLLEPGGHEIELLYDPASTRWSLWLSFLAGLLCLLGWFRGALRKSP